ncbi:hypothetical protein AB9F38_34965, partial [Rhizobium leguminosarum]
QPLRPQHFPERGDDDVAKFRLVENLLANKAQLSLWLRSAFERKKEPEVLNFICALPLYHIFALKVNSLMGMSLGAHNILIANP